MASEARLISKFDTEYKPFVEQFNSLTKDIDAIEGNPSEVQLAGLSGRVDRLVVLRRSLEKTDALYGNGETTILKRSLLTFNIHIQFGKVSSFVDKITAWKTSASASLESRNTVVIPTKQKRQSRLRSYSK